MRRNVRRLNREMSEPAASSPRSVASTPRAAAAAAPPVPAPTSAAATAAAAAAVVVAAAHPHPMQVVLPVSWFALNPLG